MGVDRQERADVELFGRRVHQHRAPRAVCEAPVAAERGITRERRASGAAPAGRRQESRDRRVALCAPIHVVLKDRRLGAHRACPHGDRGAANQSERLWAPGGHGSADVGISDRAVPLSGAVRSTRGRPPRPLRRSHLGVCQRSGLGQRLNYLAGLRWRDRITRDVNSDAPLDTPVKVLLADDGDSDGVRPTVVGRVLDCPALPVEKSLALFPGANPCCVFGVAGYDSGSSVAPLARNNTLRSVTIYLVLPIFVIPSVLRTLIVDRAQTGSKTGPAAQAGGRYAVYQRKYVAETWRWRRDLNPRTGVTRHTLSRRAP